MGSSIFIPDIFDENPNGIFATNPVRATLPVITAPTTDARPTATNTIRQELIVVACANLKESNFAFDSSVVAPNARGGFVSMAALLRRHAGCPMTIFGHADPTGELHYNHILSERRARAVFAVLVRDVAIWERLFSDQEGAIGDVWGVKSLQLMLAALGSDPGSSGVFDEATRDAFRAVLALAPKQPVTNNAATRAKLFAKYMDFLRGEPDLAPKFPALTPNDFLGRGKQKATLQGCSSFNPQLLLTKTEQTDFDRNPKLKDARDAANEPNRRVMIYLFAKGTVIDPAKWPCPAATEGEGACVARQWSNGKDRRLTRFVDHRRRFGREVTVNRRVLSPPNETLADELGKEEKTFGCRFYHGIALHSPCERDLKLWAIQLLVDAATPLKPGGNKGAADKVPVAGRRFVAIVGTSADAPTIRGRTSDNGMLALPLFDPNVAITLKIDAFDALLPPPPPKDPNDPANPPPAKTNSDIFEDEDQFLQIRLDAGALKPVRVRDDGSLFFDPDFDVETPPPTPQERELAGLQRLYNLGFGSDDTGGANFGNWTPADRKRFITQFQVDAGIAQTGVVDVATADALFESHGS